MRKDTVSDSEYSSCESESDVSSNPNDSEIEGLVKSKNCSHERKERDAKKGERSAMLDEISQEFDINEKGPRIDDRRNTVFLRCALILPFYCVSLFLNC
jgi:hypothetical protein